MNKTKIEWCDSTWNPVTGCRHGCPYCYARSVAGRFGGRWDDSSYRSKGGDGGIHTIDDPLMRHTTGKNHDIGVHSVVAPFPFGFDPTFHRYRLEQPSKKAKGQTIFVCSMADLFGAWVPTRWIVEVLDTCRKVPQHRYLFLTKNPKRYIELEHMALLPHEDNFWFGSTVTNGEDYAAWMKDIGCHWFLSIEPLLGPVDLTAGSGPMPEWVIIGAETGNRKEKVRPEYEWVQSIVSDCVTFNVPVFMKDSMKTIWPSKLFREFPWDYACPVCHNMEHLPGSKFCMVCGTAFPLNGDGR